MFIDHLAVKSYSAPEERNVPAPPRFRCSAAFKVGVAPQFYKHFVPLGLKTTTKNRKLLFCDDFRNATLDCPLVWSFYFLNHSNLYASSPTSSANGSVYRAIRRGPASNGSKPTSPISSAATALLPWSSPQYTRLGRRPLLLASYTPKST